MWTVHRYEDLFNNGIVFKIGDFANVQSYVKLD